MEKKRNLSSLIMPTFSILFCLTLLSMWLMSNIYARYTTKSSGGDSARVAAYVFELKDSSESTMVDLNNIRKPGDSQTYTFSVTNKRGNVISEVAQSYTIKLEAEGSMPITCEIREQNETGQTAGPPICKAEIAENAEAVNTKNDSSCAIRLSAAEEYTKTYTLTATWPETYNDEKYASASGTSIVTLTVDAQQLD